MEPEEVRDVFHIFAEELEKRNLDIKLYGPGKRRNRRTYGRIP